MPWLDIIWERSEPDGNVAHIAEHGITPDEVEQVLLNPEFEGRSASTGRPFAEGYTVARRYIMVVFERIDDVTVYPITAYEVEP